MSSPLPPRPRLKKRLKTENTNTPELLTNNADHQPPVPPPPQKVAIKAIDAPLEPTVTKFANRRKQKYSVRVFPVASDLPGQSTHKVGNKVFAKFGVPVPAPVKKKSIIVKEVLEHSKDIPATVEVSPVHDKVVLETETKEGTSGRKLSKVRVKRKKTRLLGPTKEVTSLLENRGNGAHDIIIEDKTKIEPEGSSDKTAVKVTVPKGKVDTKEDRRHYSEPHDDNEDGVTRITSILRTGEDSKSVKSDKSVKIVLDEDMKKVVHENTKKVLDENTKKVLDENTKKVLDEKTKKVLEEHTKNVLDENTKDGLDEHMKKVVKTPKVGKKKSKSKSLKSNTSKKSLKRNKKKLKPQADTQESDGKDFDPLDAENIRKAATYEEWAAQAKQTLPSKTGAIGVAGIELDSDLGTSVSKDVVNKTYDTSKLLIRNPNDPKELRRELGLRRSIIHPSTRGNSIVFNPSSRRSTIARRATVFDDLIHPMLLNDTVSHDEENPKIGVDESGSRIRGHSFLQPEEPEEVELSTAEKISELRNIAAHLSRKRSLKKMLREEADFHQTENKMKITERIYHFFELYLLLLKSFLHDLSNSVSVLVWWKNDLNFIESNYGAETYIYFRWIRVIIFLNCLYLLTAVFLLIIPEFSIAGFYEFYDGIGNLKISNMFTGEGSFTDHNARFYYSGYRATPLKRYFESTPFRYILSLIIVFIINSIFIGYKVSYFYHSTRLETEIPGASVPNSIIDLICAWHHSICTPTAAKLRHQTIARDLRLMIMEIRNESKSDHCDLSIQKTFEKMLIERFGTKITHLIIFWLINTCTVALSVVNAVILFYLHRWRHFQIVNYKHLYQDATNTSASPQSPPAQAQSSYVNKYPGFYIYIAPSLYTLVSAQAFILLQLYFSKFEPRISLEKKLFTMLLRVGFFWLCEISVMYIAREILWDSMKENGICWEVTFGSEFYRLIVLQEIVNFIFTLILDIYPHLKHKSDPKYPLPIFDVNRHTLNIIYIHTLSGLGFVYCPLISLVVIVRLAITFYHEKHVLFNWTTYNNNEINLRTSQIYVPYLTALFVSYIISSSLNVFLILRLKTSGSKICGPFEMEHYSDSAKEAFGAVSIAVIKSIGSPGFNFVLLFLVGGMMFMMRAWAQAYYLKMIKLHELLELEKKDRDFLMRAIYNIAKAQEEEKGKPQPHSNESSDSGSYIEIPDDHLQEMTSCKKWKNTLQNLIETSHPARNKPLHHHHHHHIRKQKKSKQERKSLEITDFLPSTSTIGSRKSVTFIDRKHSHKDSDSLGKPAASILRIRSRRMSNAEALFLASNELMPHHTTVPLKTIDDNEDFRSTAHAMHGIHDHHLPSHHRDIRFGSLYSIKPSVYDKDHHHGSVYSMHHPHASKYDKDHHHGSVYSMHHPHASIYYGKGHHHGSVYSMHHPHASMYDKDHHHGSVYSMHHHAHGHPHSLHHLFPSIGNVAPLKTLEKDEKAEKKK